MKKAFAFINSKMCGLILLMSSFAYGQTPQISTSFPKIAPPSPTVSSLMKFEEIPVNNYTGVPDISIPLFSTQTRSKDISLNLSLRYHPASIAAKEIAGYAGLGWNLFAGGTISRTVRGLPDEINKTQDPKKFGIYFNDYYSAEYDGFNTAPQNTFVEQFLWEAVEKGELDTEHDLYQYNFMGNSGSFYMRKTSSGYQIKYLNNDNTIRVEYNGFSFTLTDDKGYKYVFDVTESTTINTTTTVKYFKGTLGEVYPDGVSELTYVSAYHLSRIEDNTTSTDANRLVTFNYFPQVFEERARDVSESTSVITSTSMEGLDAIFDNGACGGPMYHKLEPEQILTIQMRTTGTKKLQNIVVPNKAKIYFTLDSDRQDRTYTMSTIAKYRLHEVLIKDWQENLVKKYELFHSYSEIKENNVRMLLDRVTENDSQSYNLFYNSSGVDMYSDRLGIDYWGFYNYKPSNKAGGTYKETASAICTTDVLNTMELPTGGSVNFEFESNDYSYNGAIRLEDFTENPDRFLEASTSVILDERRTIPIDGCGLSNPINCPFLKIQDKQTVRFIAQRDPSRPSTNWLTTLCDLTYAGGLINNTPSGGETWGIGDGGHCPGLLCPVELELEPNWYYAFFDGFDIDMNHGGLNYMVGAFYLERNPATYYRKYLIGGGVRIKSIIYIDDSKILGQKSYNYDFTNEPGRSSGSLAFPKPVYKSGKSVRPNIKQPEDCKLIEDFFLRQPISYETTTSFDNLKPINTQGSFVGYKNVTVSQTGFIPAEPGTDPTAVRNGKTEYTYTSPIDAPVEYGIDYEATPNPTYIVPFPFTAPVNQDFKRGILKIEKVYDENDKLLVETAYEHNIIEESSISGIRPYSPSQCPFGKLFYNYIGYMANYTNCPATTETTLCYNCGDPSAYIASESIDVLEKFGWVRLTGKTTKNYFYDKSNNQNVIKFKETFDYQSNNKQIIDYTKETYNKPNTTPEKIANHYTYLSGQNDISKIWIARSLVNNEQVSYQTINYSNSLSVGNSDNLPGIITAAKGTGGLENMLRFNRYDIFGSPVEVQKENGIPNVYIYDYNHHEVIATIENATYAQVTTSLGTPSNPNGYTEADMAGLNNLRTALPDSYVTTYTYKPLVGISTVTDPRGRTTKYYYDNFGRLIKVVDHENKVVSENVYKYRNQN